MPDDFSQPAKDATKSIRSRLENARGDEYWSSLEELADTPAFRELLHKEYPAIAAVVDSAMNRRQFLKLLGASLALAGLSACATSPAEKILPYVNQPEDLVPGEPLYFASAMPFLGYARGVLVKNHLGRPTKVEGNPNHPDGLGATDAFTQASILSLYDPDRSQVVTFNGQIRTYDRFLQEFGQALEVQKAIQGSGFRILTETVTSPTLADQIRRIFAAFPKARWHQYEPEARDNTRAGARMAFGRFVETTYRFDQADVILSLDSDFLAMEPGSLRYAHDYAQRRKVEPAQTSMNRMYVVESSVTITGAKADHRLPLRAADIEGFARALASTLGAAGIANGQPSDRIPSRWITFVAKDLSEHAGSSLVLAGENQPPVVHAIAHALNAKLGNVGKTVIYTDPAEPNPIDQISSLQELAADLGRGAVDLLLIVGGNPVYYAPVDLQFGQVIKKAGLSVHSGLYQDETAALCQWHVPQSHYLEMWSDIRAYDGTVSIIQPLIAPLYGSKSIHEVLAACTDNPSIPGHDIVQGYWKSRHGDTDFDAFWRRALNDGIIRNSQSEPITPNLTTGWGGNPVTVTNELEVNFRADPTVHDGRYANNAWLQELPKPLTRLTWDNVALASPATAQRMGLRYELAGEGGEHGGARTDVVQVRFQGRAVRAPVWITPGQPDDVITVYLGYGRTRAGNVGSGIGYNAYDIRTSSALWFGPGELVKVGELYELASVQQHNQMEGRGLVRSATIQEFIRNPSFAKEGEQDNPPSLYPPYEYNGYKWGMAIDINACVGCNACVVACQAENNIPVVGKDQVRQAREMHWLRIDTYHKGEAANPETYFEPVPCMHCENAPCELVCPVAATVHSSEGLNEMVYNRCVGTRYCSNNCPYKVRRFNFLQFSDWTTASLKPMRNPDVTVRSRGVMEKCTYCVQRINHARIDAEREGRTIKDGEVVTACQAACPADAIVFGDLNDKNSRVVKVKASPRDYSLLSELNTRPRTTYQAAVRNPNPDLEGT